MEFLRTFVTFESVLAAYILAPLCVVVVVGKDGVRPLWISAPASLVGLLSGVLLLTCAGMLLVEGHLPGYASQMVDQGALGVRSGLKFVVLLTIWPVLLVLTGGGAIWALSRPVFWFFRYVLRVITRSNSAYRNPLFWDMSAAAIDRGMDVLFTAPADMNEEQRASLRGLSDWASEQNGKKSDPT